VPATPLLHVALLEPEIPPNTGNIARLCAATGTRLHLIGRLGFQLDDRNLKRAGCDFWPEVDWQLHDTWADFEAQLGTTRLICFSARATVPYTAVRYRRGDCLLFGPESRGLPASILQKYSDTLVCLPMPTGKVRSLNLATAAGIGLYEALRQLEVW
jgi:tRNA (cytidine/uridine-2'-O-)-methyltransferase